MLFDYDSNISKINKINYKNITISYSSIKIPKKKIIKKSNYRSTNTNDSTNKKTSNIIKSRYYLLPNIVI
jgi:hypothetical protein